MKWDQEFPRDGSLKQRWNNARKQKDFIPGELCSLHFQGGKKIGSMDVPAIIISFASTVKLQESSDGVKATF